MSSTTLVRYKTHPQHAEENAALVRAVFQALQQSHPTGLRYQCLRADDGVTFTHVATTDEGAGNPLAGLPAFQAFLAGLRARCEELPARLEGQLVGRYEG
jgi:hypothetical protein